jgi:prolyl oligopeptidase
MFKYPKTKKTNAEETLFGVTVSDPYRWMENEGDEDLVSWIESQNQLTHAYLEEIPERDQIKKRLKELYNFPKYNFMLNVVGTKIIYGYNDGLQNQSVYYMQDGLEGESEILLDPNALSEDGTIAVTLNGHSKDNRYLAFLQAQSGSDWQILKVMDLEKKELLRDELTWVKFTYTAWYGDGFFYSGYDKPEAGKELSAKNENMKVYYHKLGEAQSQDRLIYSDPEHPLRFNSVQISENKNWLILTCSEGTYGSEVRIRRVDAENEPFKMVFKGFDNNFEYIGSEDDELFFVTDKGASNKKIVKVNAHTLKVAELIGESDENMENAFKVGNHMVVHYLKDVVSALYLYDTKGNLETEVKLPGIGACYALFWVFCYTCWSLFGGLCNR